MNNAVCYICRRTIRTGFKRSIYAISDLVIHKIVIHLSIKVVFVDRIVYNINSIPLKPLNNAQMSGVFLFYGEAL